MGMGPPNTFPIYKAFDVLKWGPSALGVTVFLLIHFKREDQDFELLKITRDDLLAGRRV